MKKTLTVFTAFAVCFLFSCNSVEDKKTGKATTPATIPPASFKVVMIKHPVADFTVWKAAYDSHDSAQHAYGLTPYGLGRGIDDSNMVFAILKTEDVQKAKEFSALPDLKEVMQKAGVTGPPVFNYIDVVRDDDSKIEQKDRVMIILRVKNFDAWLRIYDDEGMNIRKENGFIDRGLGRGVGDPNMVYIIFAIIDVNKAKERISSAELKRLMTDAGVEGTPQTYFYKLVD